MFAISTYGTSAAHLRQRGIQTMEVGNPVPMRRTVEFGSRDALANVIPLPPSEAALDDSGYSLHGTRADAITCSLGTPDRCIGEVTRLSPTVVWVKPYQPVEGADSRPMPVYLTSCGVTLGPLHGAIIRADAETPGAPVGLQLVGVTLEQGRQILSLLSDALLRGLAEPAASALPVQDTIVQAERIRSILAAISASGNKGVLRRQGRTVRMVLEGFDPVTGQLAWRTDEAAPLWGEAPYDVEVIGYNSAYRMTLDAGTANGNQLLTPLPLELFRIRHRWHRRVPAPAGVSVRFHHPLWRELGGLEREVLDLSFSGMCIRCKPEDLVFPGLLPPLIELDTGNGQTLSLRGEIRYVSSTRADGSVLCGLNVLPYSSDEADWVRFVSQTLSPATRTSEEQLEALWELFTRSGYFSLAGRSAQEFEDVRLAFRDVAKRAADAPQLFCQAVWPSERGIEATLSFLKPYQHTWLGHQVAKLPGKAPPSVKEPGLRLRDVYVRTFEHPQSDADFRWVVAYVEAQNPFMAKAHVRYAERQMETGQGLAYTQKVHMLNVFSHELTGRSYEGLSVGPATPRELDILAGSIARSRPGCYVESLDFTRDRLDMRGIQAKWKEIGMEREREILVARRGGVPVAATVLELGQLGTNLFCLLDMARLFPLVEGGELAYAALTDAARRWYASRRRNSFIYLCEDDGGAYIQEAGIREGPDPYMWIISSKLVPDFLEHISELTVGRRGAHGPQQGRPLGE